MKTPRLTAEIALRVDQLYTASARLKQRAGYHRVDRNFGRANRADSAASRLSTRAYLLLTRQLSYAEHVKLCQLSTDLAAVRAPRRTAEAA